MLYKFISIQSKSHGWVLEKKFSLHPPLSPPSPLIHFFLLWFNFIKDNGAHTQGVTVKSPQTIESKWLLMGQLNVFIFLFKTNEHKSGLH